MIEANHNPEHAYAGEAAAVDVMLETAPRPALVWHELDDGWFSLSLISGCTATLRFIPPAQPPLPPDLEPPRWQLLFRLHHTFESGDQQVAKRKAKEVLLDLLRRAAAELEAALQDASPATQSRGVFLSPEP